MIDKIYKNEDQACDCSKCELANTCSYTDKYQRLPRTIPGALGLCKKLKKTSCSAKQTCLVKK